MKKLISIFTLCLLLASISYGAFHKPGVSIYLSSTEQPRDKSANPNVAATGNVNTLFYLMADAYTTYHESNPTGYGDQSSYARVYWPIYSDEYLVGSQDTKTGYQYTDPVTHKAVYSYNVNACSSYTGWVAYYKVYAHISTPLGYVATANAYVQWED